MKNFAFSLMLTIYISAMNSKEMITPLSTNTATTESKITDTIATASLLDMIKFNLCII